MSSRGGTSLEQVAHGGNLQRAWELLNKQNPGSFGIDRVRISDFAESLKSNLSSIRDRLLSGTYRFAPTRPVLIRKASGKGFRPLRIPTVADRVVQKAILLRLEKIPAFRKFRKNPASFAYVRGRTLRDLVKRTQRLILTHSWVLESDIVSFFDTVNQGCLIRTIEPLLPDPSALSLLSEALRAEVGHLAGLPAANAGLFPGPGEGLPQGVALSPLLSNVYLHRFDMGLRRRHFEHVRYADDFIVFARTRNKAHEAYELCKQLLSEVGLKIPELNAPVKPSRILPASGGFDFVGLRFEKNCVLPTKRAIDHLCNNLVDVMSPRTATTLLDRYLRCERFLSGWSGAYRQVVSVKKYIDLAADLAAESAHALLRSRGLAHNDRPTRRQRAFLAVLPHRVSQGQEAPQPRGPADSRPEQVPSSSTAHAHPQRTRPL